MEKIKRKYNADVWKKRVLQDLPKYRNRRYFKRVYDKLKTVEFKDKDKLNMEKHFYMPKLQQDWDLSDFKNALAIYPVLCGRADFKDDTKWVRISRENIGKLAGIWAGAVDKGISTLMNSVFVLGNSYSTPLLQRREWQDGQRRGHEYLPGFFRYEISGINPHQWKGQYFVFHTCIVDHGIWSELSRKAKALYWAMRSRAFFDQQVYQHIEDIYIPGLDEVYPDYLEDDYEPRLNGDDEKMKFRNRKWDICNTSIKELFQLARIPYTDTRLLVDELVDHGLVERALENKSVFKVYLKPKQLLKN